MFGQLLYIRIFLYCCIRMFLSKAESLLSILKVKCIRWFRIVMIIQTIILFHIDHIFIIVFYDVYMATILGAFYNGLRCLFYL